MEVVLPKMRISGKRSQDHQEEQQAKKAKNRDEEMDIGKKENEDDDGYQPNTKQRVLRQQIRKEEMDFMEKFCVYEDATIEECFTETGRAPVGTKWVDVNKGTAENPNIRCSLVARDFKPKGEKDRADLFASMPPLEAKKVFFSIAATHEKEFREGRWQRPKLMFIDVKRGSSERQVGS